ncbi:vanadium-dependent haloperoxidase [Polyangium sp. 6x1]|uniref:vanadium-dependent haloperoxidase n=1 Tax=Polyangium sp. 6x1 TaxID=3042689 RepID=UPI0024825B4F|nr:vanadium-dependent haloperoxidase [Polyangium sp. 6x1]MDI1447994.1 vanadium-dependent haloperoxidase [Polyangium sp. 6x1]
MRSTNIIKTLLASGLALAAIHSARPASAFDLDTGNAALEVVVQTAAPVILSTVSPSDASLILRVTAVTTTAWFDAIAPYGPTTVGVYSRLGRRPPGESVTNRNKNIALLYASYRTLNSLIPKEADVWTDMLLSVGLDPNDTSTDITTAVGIGNVAGAAVVSAREHDGMNQLGDEGGCLYNCQPYADYLGYSPVNTAYVVKDASRWQPNITTTGNGIFLVQQFVTPQWSVTTPFSYADPSIFFSPPPFMSRWKGNGFGKGVGFADYKEQADQVLQVSAALTDAQKMTAEFFNDKIRSLGASTAFAAATHGLTLDEFVQLDFLVNLAAFDGGIATWQEKLRYDAVRPFTAIRVLYGDTPVQAWGGPGKGTVTDLPASQWKSYLNVADHPEYPSGSACFCAAHAEASRRFLGSDNLGWVVSIPQGSSLVEPGITPAQDITLSFATWTQFEEICGMSRNWGGVHFLASISSGRDLCSPIGDLAYEFVKAHIAGTTP